MEKRGSTHVDWAISAAIFFLFVIFAAIYARPLYAPLSNLDALAEIVVENFMENASLTVDIAPIYVDANVSYDDAPIILDYPYELDTSRIFLQGLEVGEDGDRLIFIGDLSAGTTAFTLVESSSPLATSEQQLDLFSTQTFTTVTDFVARFTQGSLQQMDYGPNLVAFTPSYHVEGQLQENFTSAHNATHVFAKYTLENPTLHIEQFIFARTPGISTYITPKQVAPGMEQEVSVFMRIRNYTQYYANPLDNDLLDYETNDCDDLLDPEHVTFSDGRLGALTFSFDPPPSLFYLCADGTSINLTLTFSVNETLSYKMIGHGGNHLNATKYQDLHVPRVGYFVENEGISITHLENFSSLAYEQRKKTWNYPGSRNFQIEIYNDTSQVFSYSPVETSVQTDVFTKTTFVPLIDTYGNITYGKLYVRVW